MLLFDRWLWWYYYIKKENNKNQIVDQAFHSDFSVVGNKVCITNDSQALLESIRLALEGKMEETQPTSVSNLKDGDNNREKKVRLRKKGKTDEVPSDSDKEQLQKKNWLFFK